jgi:hypothetical protein
MAKGLYFIYTYHVRLHFHRIICTAPRYGLQFHKIAGIDSNQGRHEWPLVSLFMETIDFAGIDSNQGRHEWPLISLFIDT